MRFFKQLILFIALFGNLVAFGQEVAMLTVKVDSIRSVKGVVFAAVFTSQDAFKADHALQRAKSNVSGFSTTIEFNLPKNKAYMVALFQDLNGNKKLDTRGAMNVPNEPVGFSNNKPGRFGPPPFKETSFNLNGDTTISIQIISSRKEYFNRVK